MRRSKEITKYRGSKAIVLLFGLFFIFNALPSFAQTKLSISTILLGTLGWPMLVASEKGLFSQEGLAVEMLELRKASLVAQSVIARSTPIAVISTDAAIMAMEKGANISIISSVIKAPTSVLVALPKYRSVKELKKVKIGTAGPGGTTTQLEMILNQEGLRRNDDYILITIGSTRERYLALKVEGIDAAILSPTASFEAVDAGLSVLAYTGNYMKDYIQLVSAVNASYAVDHPDIVVKYLKSMIKAGRWLTDPKNKEMAVNILIKYEKMTPQTGQRVYDYLVNQIGAVSRDGDVNPDGMRSVMAVLARTHPTTTPDYKKFLNLKYLALAHKELGITN